MKEFNLEEYLKNPNLKVITRDGRSVEILKTNLNGFKPIVGIIKNQNKDEEIYLWHVTGQFSQMDSENNADLFFADSNDGLSVFEKNVRDIISNHLNIEVDVNSLKHISNEFLKMMESEWSNGWNSAQKGLIKNMPTLEKVEKIYDPTIPFLYTNLCTSKSYVEMDGYRICVNDLFNKLPKEE